MFEILFNLPVVSSLSPFLVQCAAVGVVETPSTVFFLLTGSILKPVLLFHLFYFICMLSRFSQVQLFETL